MKRFISLNNREEKGITLIALIVTVIVLLILAGISIGMLTSNNGVLKQSREAKSNTNESQVKEAVQLALYEVIGNAAVADSTFTAGELETAIKAYYANTTVTGDATSGWTATVIDGTGTDAITYTVPINTTGQIGTITTN